MKSQYFITSYEKAKRNKIFIFPYAGGGVSAFKNWQEEFVDTEVLVAQYPGRENRIKEKPIDNLEFLVREVFNDIKPLISDNIPYFLFGHSMGTKVVYELALLIQKSNLPFQPSGIIISAGKAPCYKENNPIHGLAIANFVNEISRFSGTPKEILGTRTLMDIFIPMLRADFKMDETYKRETAEKINCPILALMGTEDPELTLEELLTWREYTEGEFTYKSVEGAHMFINTYRAMAINAIGDFINE
ncbi:MAG: thioesterase II family protein [Ruminiclostridium sp.]